MTLLSFALIILSQFSNVAGQILLKHGMNHFGRKPRQLARLALGLSAGIAMLTVWFLVWMGLLQKMDLSFVYPFEGISPVLLVGASTLFLRERVDSRTAYVGGGAPDHDRDGSRGDEPAHFSPMTGLKGSQQYPGGRQE